MKNKVLRIVLCLFIGIKSSNTNSINNRMNTQNIAGIKTPYFLTSEEEIKMKEISQEIKNTFQQIIEKESTLQNNSNQNANNAKLSSNNQSISSVSSIKAPIYIKNKTSGKSFFQVMQEKKDRSNKIPFSQITQQTETIRENDNNQSNNNLSNNNESMSPGERVIYYKRKYLQLAKKYLDLLNQKTQKNNES